MTTPKIYLFSGLGSSLIPSFREGNVELSKRILGLGSIPRQFVWNDWENAFRDIYVQHQQNKDLRIALIGHSNGVLACARLAEYLSYHNIPVEYVGAVDPTLAPFPEFGDNVKRVHEFHATRGTVSLVRRLTRGYLGSCKFTGGWSGDHELETIKGSHTGIATDEKVLDKIVENVRWLF